MQQEHHEVVIAGGGIGGLILALCLDAQYNHSPSTSTTTSTTATTTTAPETNENKIEIHVYESASEFSPGAGGAIGLYANGLRVLRDLSNRHPLLTSLLDDVRTAGCDYIYRRWMRHDGTEVCVAKEDELLKTVSDTNSYAADDDTTNLHSLGIRRWKYQKILYDACVKVGIVVHLGKRLIKITSLDRDGNTTTDDELLLPLLLPMTKLEFIDKSTITCTLLIGADGLNSTCRRYVSNPLTPTIYPEPEEFVPLYTGVTCLMGCANVPFIRGICFPSSATTKCHGCFYPTHVSNEQEGDNDDERHEMIFQLYFPSPIERPDQWRTLTPGEAKIEGRELATKLRADGWDEMFLAPLEDNSLTGVLRVGIRNREALATWHVPQPNGPVVGPAVLLGDAAHPPVPYIGQGAMMATEDAGTLALVLKEYCPMLPTTTDTTTTMNRLDLSGFNKAMETYEQLRVGRVMKVLGSSVELGKTQQKRADSALYNLWRELSIKTQVWLHGTLPVMRLGAAFDYRAKVTEALAVKN